MSAAGRQRQTLIFAGTPEFAARALQALLDAGHPVALVLTQPDRPAGRGMKLQPSPVKALALAHGLRVEQPASLRDAATQQMLRQLIESSGVDVMVVAAYGLILPQAVLDLPPAGCLNIHASLLPRWRGAAPIQRAIEAGDSATGVAIMQMEAGLDTGPVLLEAVTPIDERTTGASLHDSLAQSGAALIVDALARLDQLTPQPQAEAGVTYAHKIAKAEAALDFSRPAEELARRIRAFDPFPGCSAVLGDDPAATDAPSIKFWSAVPVAGQGAPGEILQADASGIVIACGSGALRVSELQKPGSKRLPAREFLAGLPLRPGQRFRRPAPA
ncbi:MAG TPA: methionyl-tRNA formyltransferase [Rhodocyclaceae bacterium]|nr:methionyl-tRNA formyltransferase [Rhodocyclaceae bacterium]